MTPTQAQNNVPPPETDILRAAIEYHRQGWSIIQLRYGTKKPALKKWKPYQHTRPAEADILKWFSKPRNIGVICGPVSGGLTCRDFDNPDAYDRWAAEYPDLARLLPTVKTGRGYHVYFSSLLNKIQDYPDESGELRGGGYCLLPPSMHENGTQYRWIIKPNGKIPEVDFRIFRPDATERTEDNRDNGSIQKSAEDNISNVNCFGVFGFNDSKISEIIDSCLPTEQGQRNHRLFCLARQLKGQPELRDAAPATLRKVVRQWHNRAAGVIRTKDFLTSWGDFLYGWERVKFPADGDPVKKIVDGLVAGTITPPDEIVRDYPGETGLGLLAGLCRELARLSGPDGVFFLSCRKSAQWLNIDPSTASRWLLILKTERLIQEVKKGNIQSRRATRWRYLKEK